MCTTIARPYWRDSIRNEETRSYFYIPVFHRGISTERCNLGIIGIFHSKVNRIVADDNHLFKTHHDPIWLSKHGRLNGILLKKYLVTFICIESLLGRAYVMLPAMENSSVPGVTIGLGWIFT